MRRILIGFGGVVTKMHVLEQICKMFLGGLEGVCFACVGRVLEAVRASQTPKQD